MDRAKEIQLETIVELLFCIVAQEHPILTLSPLLMVQKEMMKNAQNENGVKGGEALLKAAAALDKYKKYILEVSERENKEVLDLFESSNESGNESSNESGNESSNESGNESVKETKGE